MKRATATDSLQERLPMPECRSFESHGLEVKRLYGVGMDLRIAPDVEPVSGAVRLALFRIGQEAIRNACLHGRAQRVTLSLARNNGHVALRVNDDGVGFNVDVARRGGGLGLVSMEERARLIKGRFDVTSTPGRGSDVEVLVPAPLPDADRSFTLVQP